MHMLADHFPDDGQGVSDPEWMAYGLEHGWSLLTQDMRIATQPAAAELLRQYRGVIHCLDSAQLSVATRAERFHTRQRVIYQHITDRRTGFYVVKETGAPRRKRLGAG